MKMCPLKISDACLCWFGVVYYEGDKKDFNNIRSKSVAKKNEKFILVVIS